jgi:hypothetical protein
VNQHFTKKNTLAFCEAKLAIFANIVLPEFEFDEDLTRQACGWRAWLMSGSIALKNTDAFQKFPS